MNTMTAVRIHEFGGPEVLRRERLPIPSPGAGQVSVLVHAASVNPVDYKIRGGKYPAVGADKLPFTLGRDFSGVVEHVGAQVEQFKPGDEVYGFMGQADGTFREFLVIDAAAVARKPRELDFVHAAAVPLAALTAWQGIFDQGGLQAGQRILIHAAAGGVGHFALQFAKARGAHTIVTASGSGLDLVRELGADEVIDYKAQRFEEVVRDMDVVFDLIAGETQDRSWQVLKKGGALVSTLKEPSPEKGRELGIRTSRFTARADSGQLTEIGELIDSGKVKVVVVETFPFDQVERAIQRVEDGHVHGKVVVDVLERT